ncbi:SgcJ/EcaC family oxidoreductase [Arthrobacter sp. AZCC_0090]|uniref:SgcJ/EcaC family oxidoreductase n=1 Tax=Arthrobacter sp. AZCC_0090 TaxID=2735881 RepID=UPI001621C386|nr:SgcJ/EcaC family oxidoreductase [Arthrobacter sp. AZCC_0090]MBB6407175.1 uncharacterized protein (TIGR02246 family) [Arthrobacter sp. AZCC_0090]
MDDLEILAAKFACLELLNAVRKAADDGDASAYADGFAHDGVWIPGSGVPIHGRDVIRAALCAIPSDRVTRHVSGGSVIGLPSSDTAVIQTQMVLYSGSDAGGMPVPLQLPDKIFDYNDELQLTVAGWKIKKRATALIFTRPA